MSTVSEYEKACLVSGGKYWLGSNGERRIYLKKHHLVLLVDLDLSRLSLALVRALTKSITYFDCGGQYFWTDAGIIRDILRQKGFPVHQSLFNERQGTTNVGQEKGERKSYTAVNFNRLHYMERD